MDYSISYIILLTCYLIIALSQLTIKFDEKSHNFLNGVVLFSFIIFFGFRGYIGWDWHSYYPFFKDVNSIQNFNLESNATYDVGFVIFSAIIKSFTKDYNLFVIVNTLVDGILLHFFFKRYLSKNLYVFGFVLFIVMEGIILEVNLMRNIKGILIFLLSIRYIEKRNFLKYFLLNLLGLSFHWSSIIFFPLYFFIHKKLNLKIFFGIFIVGNILYLTQIEFIKPIIMLISNVVGGTVKDKTNIYLNSSLFNNQYGITLGYLEKVCTSLLIMLYYNKLTEKHKANTIFINCYIIFIFINLYFSEISIIITRFGNLFIFSYWILVSQIIDLSKNALKYILFFLLSVYLNVRIMKITDNILFKYDNILFDKHLSYEQRELIFKNNAWKLQKQR